SFSAHLIIIDIGWGNFRPNSRLELGRWDCWKISDRFVLRTWSHWGEGVGMRLKLSCGKDQHDMARVRREKVIWFGQQYVLVGIRSILQPLPNGCLARRLAPRH